MKTQAINNNQPNFGNIFVPLNCKFSAEQTKMVEKIVSALREPSPKFKNKTAENYYKSKKRIDFKIRPSKNMSDYVCLECIKNAKTTKEKAITFDKEFMIGVYSNNHPFKTDDIKTVIDVLEDKPNNWGFPILTGLLAICSYVGIKMSDKTKQISKPLTETIDTISNKAKEILPDTTKTKIIKTIKQ